MTFSSLLNVKLKISNHDTRRGTGSDGGTVPGPAARAAGRCSGGAAGTVLKGLSSPTVLTYFQYITVKPCP